MPLAAGQTLSFYEILGPIGAGGMGEVYRARDTRLEREVALKVLPAELADDEERLRRFEREAKTLASLSHANVAQVFGIDRVDDLSFMAMELVPGEDLAARLSRGPLSPAEARDVCWQIAAGLEAAHEAGVIHRDLKPANVVLTPDGNVKVLDFGLAKPTPAAAGGGATSDSASVTEAGRVLGTPRYMAPEQARGKPIDRRVDVWAFGCVLYECLVGERAFEGASVAEVLAEVLEKEPDWRALPASTSAPIRDLVKRCLRKDPKMRLRDIGDARIALEEADQRPAAVASTTGRPAWTRAHTVCLAVAVVLAAALGYWGASGSHPADDSPRYVSVPITASHSYRSEPSWSPEGEWIALGRMESGSEDLYLRHVSSGEETLRRAGPGDESCPAWSPDGKYLAFVASDMPGTPVLYAPPYSDGGERVLTTTNMRVFESQSYSEALGDRPWASDSSSLLVSRVTDTGQIAIWEIGLHDGVERQLTFPPVGSDDLGASYSFDWERIVFARRDTHSSKLMLMPAGGGAPVDLVDNHTAESPAWHPDGKRVLYQSTASGAENVWQVWVDDARAEQLTNLVGVWPGGLSVSSTGRIAYSASSHDTILTVLDLETGASTPLTSHADNNFGPRFSPDGRSIAYQSDRTGDNEIWVHDIGGAEHRITEVDGNDAYPDWSPDGERLVFVSSRDGTPKIYVADRDGGNCHVLESQSGIVAPPGGGRESMSVRWSPPSATGELVGYIVATDTGRTLWGAPPTAGRRRASCWTTSSASTGTWTRGASCARWTKGARRSSSSSTWRPARATRSGRGPHAEIDVAPDGSAVMFCRGLSHLNMGLATLELVPPDDPGGLPTARGEPVDIVRPEGRWHAHHGGWAPDAKSVVYVHDADRGNIYELVEQD